MKDKDEVQVWLEAHPQEYAQFAARMNEQGICGILKLGEEAFLSSPVFKKRWLPLDILRHLPYWKFSLCPIS